MVKDWINLYVDKSVSWTGGTHHQGEKTIKEFTPAKTVLIHETSVGGTIVMSAKDGSIACYGNPEIYLKIFFSDNSWRYLSAPLGTPIILANVEKIELSVLYIVGSGSSTAQPVMTKVLVNAHCVYEIV